MYKEDDIIKDFIGNEYRVISGPKSDGFSDLYKTIDQRGVICIVDQNGIYQDTMSEFEFDEL